jgi:endoglucanase
VVATLADDWHATVVRASIGAQGSGDYATFPDDNLARARTVIDASVAKGIYVIVDWHSHKLQQPEAVAFFTKLARAYARVPNVIWETYNEPLRQDWTDELKPYHEAVIAAIRTAGSKNLVVVGTPTWSQDVDTAALDPITTDKNVAYSLHFYAASHKQEFRDKADFAMARGAAVFVTEWGTCHSSGNTAFDPVESKRWTDWMDARGVSSANWSLHDKPETASALVPGAGNAGPWTDSELTESGRLVKAYIQAGYR